MPSKLLKSTTRLTVKASIAFAVLTVVFLTAAAFISRRQPELQKWHLQAPRGEFRAIFKGDDFSFKEYLELEERLFTRLKAFEIPAADQSGPYDISRYAAGGRANPESLERNWNRTFELVPGETRGGALLLHGLSDSPYSLRKVGEMLRDRGYHVVGLRLPGHGTTPSALLTVQWKDWLEATKLAARYLSEQIAEGLPLVVAGYSCGGALALDHAALALLEGDRRVPDRLILFSPAVEITALARFSNWNKFLAWIPYFEKDKWTPLQPEYDPFKYNSFAKNAGAQMFSLTKRLQKDLESLGEKGLAEGFPPVLTFQSAVDATTVGTAVVEKLHDRLGSQGGGLVVFDVNRAAYMEGLLARDPGGFFTAVFERPQIGYSYTLVTNASPGSLEVVAKSRLPGTGETAVTPLGSSWPTGTFSLSHVAVPFPPDDPVYGTGDNRAQSRTIHLGALALRGERGVLNVPADQLMRLRHNPFFPFVAGKIAAFVP